MFKSLLNALHGMGLLKSMGRAIQSLKAWNEVTRLPQSDLTLGNLGR